MIVPKPGEFFVVSSDQLPSLNRKLISQAIRDAHDSSPKGHRDASSNYSKTAKPLLTDRKRAHHGNERNRSSHLSYLGAGGISHPTTTKAGAQPSEGVTMSSLQGELNKHLSLPTFNKFNLNRMSHDFPATVNAQRFAAHGVETDSIQAESQFSRRIDGEAHADAPIDPTADVGVKNRQMQVLQNPQLRTSLTTSIRNIMRNQDKGLLTTSTRILNASVKKQEGRLEAQRQDTSGSPVGHLPSPPKPKSGHGKALSTIDLLRRQKEQNAWARRISQDDMSEDVRPPRMQTMANAVSMPVIPTLRQAQNFMAGSGV